MRSWDCLAEIICAHKLFAVIVNSFSCLRSKWWTLFFHTLTCAGITVPLFALGLHVGAESSGEVFVHHAANVPLVVGEEDASWAQVFCLPDLFVLRSLLYLSGRRVRWWGRTPWAGASGRNRDALWTARDPHAVHQIPAARRGASQTKGCLRKWSSWEPLRHILLCVCVSVCFCVWQCDRQSICKSVCKCSHI